jgi:excisionase family DNA binding protein
VSRLLTLAAAADELGVSTRTLRRRIAEGAVPAFRYRRIVRVHRTDLDRYITAHTAALRRQADAPDGVLLAGGERLWD